MVGSHNALNRANADEWWFGGSMLVQASHTWGGAHNFGLYLDRSKMGRKVTDPKALDLGDVVQYADLTGHIRHTMLVTGIRAGDVLLSYHTADKLDNPLSKIPANNKTFIYWKIADVVPTVAALSKPVPATSTLHRTTLP